MIRAESVQKRSGVPARRVMMEIALDPQLPITGGQPYEQHDRPITFLHRHNCLELGYCYAGSGVFVVGEKVLPFRQGDVSFINHTEPHLARSAPGTSSHWTWIYLDPIRLVVPAAAGAADSASLDPTPLAGQAFGNLLSQAEHPEVGRIVLRMVQELRSRQAGHGAALRALTWELMTLMRRLLPADVRIPRQFDRIAPAMQYLAHHYIEPVEVGRLAAMCRLSEPHFRRLFGAAVGRSPRAYWHDLRLQMAASLLQNTSRSILQISHEVGFETLSSFNRAFRASFAMTPRDWRRGQGGQMSSCAMKDA